jgi:hypothetical protein
MMRIRLTVLKDEGVSFLQTELIRREWEREGVTFEVRGDSKSARAESWQVSSYVAHSIAAKLETLTHTSDNELQIYWDGRVIPVDPWKMVETCLKSSEPGFVYPPSATFGNLAIAVIKTQGLAESPLAAALSHLASVNISTLLDTPIPLASVSSDHFSAFVDCKSFTSRPWLCSTSRHLDLWLEKIAKYFSEADLRPILEMDVAERRVRPSLRDHLATGIFPDRNRRHLDKVYLTAERTLPASQLQLVTSNEFYKRMVRVRKVLARYIRGPWTIRRAALVSYHYLVHPGLVVRRIGLRLAKGV